MNRNVSSKVCYIISALLFFTMYCHAQKVEVIKRGSVNLPKIKLFESLTLLEPAIDTTSITYIGTFKVRLSISKGYAADHLFLIMDKARKLGANSYFVESHQKDSANDMSYTTMSTYFADENVKRYNETLKPVNVVYLFGDERIYLKNKYSKFAFNGAARRIHNSAEYFVHRMTDGEIVELSKGGNVRIVGKTQLPAVYLRVNGKTIGLIPEAQSVVFAGGSIQPANRNVSEFLVKILAPVD